MSKKPSYQLEEQQVALTSYLSALLQEVPDYMDEPEPSVVEVPAVVAEAPVPPAQEPEPPVTTSTPAADVAAETASDVPHWARSRFQCLVFQVAGLSLAVPLSKLNGVIPWQGGVTPMPNRSALFLGLLHHQRRNVKVVDTALMVLPEHRQPGSLAAPEERVKHIILLDEGRWGLACDRIGEVLTLDPDDVRWRSAQGKRPWLAGTVLKHLCALLDADAFVELLLHGEQQR